MSISNRNKHQLETTIGENVTIGATLYTDALRSYDRMAARGYVHQVIDHAEAYVDGQVHTNGLENFWSLLKRAIKGTYVNIEPFHLFRYLDEQSFRFNNRKGSDAMRFALALKGIINLTGASPTAPSPARSCRKRAEKSFPQQRRGRSRRARR